MANFTNNNQITRFNQQNQNPHSVNTNSIPMYNGDMSLKLSFMNDSMSLSFIPVLVKEDGTRSFPKENGLMCVIKLEYAMVMLSWLNRYFIPQALANFEKQIADPTIALDPVVVGVPLNKDNTNMLVFRYDEPKNGSMVPTLTFHSGIGPDRRPTKSITYEFGIKNVFTNYDPNSGDYSVTTDQVQFWIFLKTLEHFIEASSMAESHAARVANSFVNKEMRSLIRQIAQKNGIATNTFTSGFDAIGAQTPTGVDGNRISASNNVANTTTVSDMFSVPDASDLPF